MSFTSLSSFFSLRSLKARWAGYVSAVLGIAAVTFALKLPGESINPTTVALAMLLVVVSGWSGGFPYTDHFPFYHQVLHNLGHGKLALSWGSLLGLNADIAFLPMVAIIAALVIRLLWVYGHVPEQRAAEIDTSLSVPA